MATVKDPYKENMCKFCKYNCYPEWKRSQDYHCVFFERKDQVPGKYYYFPKKTVDK